MKEDIVYPFSAIVGQDSLKLALILNAINPKIGGLLIYGERGTAKSTAVRSFASLLPKEPFVKGCPYNCHPYLIQNLCAGCNGSADIQVEYRHVPVVTLPLNATEEMVVGGIDFTGTIRKGGRVFQPGLLARAHRGILYIDEVNLLDDHIVDIILDAASCGKNVVEREGISLSHLSEFILVGTMNPEEGQLRPQFLDRFGFCVKVEAIGDPDKRVLLMERREAFDACPTEFIKRFRGEDEKIARRIASAREHLGEITITEHLRVLIAEICTENNVAGHRADLAIEQGARALAAFNRRFEVTTADILDVVPLAIAHRKREAQPPPPLKDKNPSEQNHPDERNKNTDNRRDERTEGSEQLPHNTEHHGLKEEGENPASETTSGHFSEKVFPVGDIFKVKRFHSRKDRLFRRGSGRRSRTRTIQRQGRYVKSTVSRGTGDIALDATLRAAAPYQSKRKKLSDLAVVIEPEDIREKIREKRIGNFLLFLVDASGSMGARGRMIASKGAVMSLLIDAYQKRDKISMVSFRKNEAIVNLPPTSSIELAAKLLREMPVGGRTPLSAGLVKAYEILRNYLIQEPNGNPIVILITDGRSNVSLSGESPIIESLKIARRISEDGRIQFIVVDSEGSGIIQLGFAKRLAIALRARYFKIEDLKAETLLEIAKENAK